jgi:predicted unusual protein kinase regulating ubiquinone biosynthesis (AarF/ABC1/UbiB family)
MSEYIKRFVINHLPRFINYMTSKNVMCTKLLQSMAGIENMPSEINEIIKKNTNTVHYTDDEIDLKLLLKVITDYKITLDSLTPINSGMVAIVFSGVNADKKRVVIKMRRNNIIERIKYGFLHFSRIYKFVKFVTYPFGYLNESLNNIKSFIDTRDFILTQCIFDNEINAIVVTKELVEKYNNDIVIPTIYNTESDRVNAEFILMDFIEGVTCYDVTEQYNERVGELLTIFSFITGYFGEIYHSDLHPGNVICIPNGDKCKIGIIDFGMHLHVTDKIRTFTVGGMNTMIQIFNGNTENHDVLKFCKDIIVPPIDIERITPEQYNYANGLFLKFIDSISQAKLNETVIHDTVSKLRKCVKYNTIILADDFVKYAMGMSMIQSSIRLLVCDSEKRPNIAKKALTQVMNY